MNNNQLGIILAVIIVAAIIVRINRLKKNKTEGEKVQKDSLDDPMQDLFFYKVSNGAEKIHLLNISGASGLQDLIVLKSLMQSVNLPYYSEFENFTAMNAGTVSKIKLYILKENYDQALEIVNNYNKTTNLSGIMVIENGV